MRNLLTALDSARLEFRPLKTSGKNQHTKNEYATIDDCWSACEEGLSRHGLIVTFDTVSSMPVDDVQTRADATQKGFLVRVAAVLHHVSGETLKVHAEAVGYDVGDKGLAKAQSFAARIALMNLLSLEMRATFPIDWPSEARLKEILKDVGDWCAEEARRTSREGPALFNELVGLESLKACLALNSHVERDRISMRRLLALYDRARSQKS
jgi:hypothetical protein